MKINKATGRLIPESSADYTHPDYLRQRARDEAEERARKEEKLAGFVTDDRPAGSGPATEDFVNWVIKEAEAARRAEREGVRWWGKKRRRR